MKTILNLLPVKELLLFAFLRLMIGLQKKDSKVTRFLIENRRTIDEFYAEYRKFIVLYDQTGRAN